MFHALVNPPPRQLSYPLTLPLDPSLNSPIMPYDLSASLPLMQKPLQSEQLMHDWQPTQESKPTQ